MVVRVLTSTNNLVRTGTPVEKPIRRYNKKKERGWQGSGATIIPVIKCTVISANETTSSTLLRYAPKDFLSICICARALSVTTRSTTILLTPSCRHTRIHIALRHKIWISTLTSMDNVISQLAIGDYLLRDVLVAPGFHFSDMDKYAIWNWVRSYESKGGIDSFVPTRQGRWYRPECRECRQPFQASASK
jgi:hypothetical protein